MKFHILLVVLGLCVLLVAARPGGGGRKDRERGRGGPGEKGHGNEQRPNEGGKPRRGGRPEGRPEIPGGRPDGRQRPGGPGEKPDRRGNPEGGRGRPERPERPDTPAGTADPDLALYGRYEHHGGPHEHHEGHQHEHHGEPHDHRRGPHRGPHHGPHHGSHRGHHHGERPHHGHHHDRHHNRTEDSGKDRERGWPHRRWWLPKWCRDMMPTEAPEMDYVTGAGEEDLVCDASCPAGTVENPLQKVCGTDGNTYASSCILQLVACVTDNDQLDTESEGECISNDIEPA